MKSIHPGLIIKRREDDLQHDGLVAEEKVKGQKAHILHAHNQEQCKQSILLSLLEDEVFISSDWAMKFLEIKFRESKQNGLQREA